MHYMCPHWHKQRTSIQHVVVPKNTYVSVLMQANTFGFKSCNPEQVEWSGAYDIGNTNVVDSSG